MSFREFAFVRLVRLAPLYLLGLALGVCAVLLSMAKTGTPQISGHAARDRHCARRGLAAVLQ